MQVIRIFSARLANELHSLGFKVIRTELNYRKPDFNVFVFEKTPELERVMQEKQIWKGGERKC